MMFLQELFGSAWPLVWTILKIVVIIVPLLLGVAYLTWVERKVIGYMQVRIGPNRVGYYGLLQPLSDGLKLFMKETIIPSAASKKIFLYAPVLCIAPALAAWAVVPFNPDLVLANVDASLLYIMALTSVGVYGIIVSGWSSNSKYSFLGAMRGAAQMVSYELAMGFALVGVLMAANSLNLVKIVLAQAGGFWQWYWLPLFPMFLVYFISGIAETNRAPFDVVEGESEIIGFHAEYSGMAFANFFMAEYANMFLVTALCSIMFLGGWLSPFPFLPDSVFWLFGKMAFLLFLFLWFRASFPRYRYDQIMRLGWKVFIPITLVWIFVVGALQQTPVGYLFH